jgi:hypothetical protein
MRKECQLCHKLHSRIKQDLCPSCFKYATYVVALNELENLFRNPQPFINALNQTGQAMQQGMRILQGENNGQC